MSLGSVHFHASALNARSQIPDAIVANCLRSLPSRLSAACRKRCSKTSHFTHNKLRYDATSITAPTLRFRETTRIDGLPARDSAEKFRVRPCATAVQEFNERLSWHRAASPRSRDYVCLRERATLSVTDAISCKRRILYVTIDDSRIED